MAGHAGPAPGASGVPEISDPLLAGEADEARGADGGVGPEDDGQVLDPAAAICAVLRAAVAGDFPVLLDHEVAVSFHDAGTHAAAEAISMPMEVSLKSGVRSCQKQTNTVNVDMKAYLV